MTTSRASFLSEIIAGERIPIGKLAYFRGRLTNRMHELVLDEFLRLSQAGKINKATLAKRIGREPAQVTRWLGAPGNWTIETLSDLLLGMGYEPSISLTALAGQNVYEMRVRNGTQVVSGPLADEPHASYKTNSGVVKVVAYG